MKSNSEYTLRERSTNKTSIIEESFYCQEGVFTVNFSTVDIGIFLYYTGFDTQMAFITA